MFFSAFCGSFCAMIVAAGALYFIRDYQDTESSKQILQATRAAKRQNGTYGNLPAGAVAAAPNDSAVELRSEVTLAKAVTTKTAEGSLTIPAGTVVHTVQEKAAPGTVHINYEGYIFAIPLSVVVPESH